MPSSLVAQYLGWRRGRDVGCAFARLIAIRPSDYLQTVVTVPSSSTPNRIAGNIERRINKFIDDDEVAAAALLLPGLTTLEDLAKVALALENQPLWSVSLSMLPNPTAGEMVAFQIVRQIPFGDGSCPSVVLVLGPFENFPPTRRAPITALEMYVGQPMSHDPQSGAPTTRAHLAHMKLELPNPQSVQTMWESTRTLRRESLGAEDDSRAKANVSFVIPLVLAQNLVCVP